MNEKTVIKHFKIWETVEHVLLVFSSLYMVESGLNHVHYLLSREVLCT